MFYGASSLVILGAYRGIHKEAVKKFLLSKVNWKCMFLQFLDKLYFPSTIDFYGFKVYTSILNLLF